MSTFDRDGIYGRWADLNGDGEIDDFEKAVEMETLEQLSGYCSGEEGRGWSKMEDDDDEEGEEDDFALSELELAGLDADELSFMDEDERREALEDAGLDPDDYDF